VKKFDSNELNHSMWSPAFLIVVIIVAAFGSIIGIQIITSLGITPNTSIIGALIAMILGRIPLKIFLRHRSTHTQNLVQTAISAGTFAAANSLLIPIGIPFLFGRTDLIIPMFIGALLALAVDAVILFRVFDSKIFPAKGIWPPGVATSEAIKAGDEGGKKAGFLGFGILAGLVGSWLGVSMSAFGVAFIGNIVALTMFGFGLLLRGYSTALFGVDINTLYVPHGVMIGAGVVALIQMIFIILNRKKTPSENQENGKEEVDENYTRSEKDTTRAFGFGFIAYLCVALIIAILGGIITHMSIGMLILYVLFAAFAAFCHEIIVGIAAMHSGWFPAFAVALITLVVGILIGFPPVALALLVGFSAATGPAFADMAYDFKTGFLLRGNGEDRVAEMKGRKQQFYSALIGFAVATIIVFLTYNFYFSQHLVPPVDKAYVATIKAGASSHIALQLLIWAIPGAILQFIGGPQRQMGILFATGLLILNPGAGWAVIVGIVIRLIILKVYGKRAEPAMFTTAAGFIGGDALYGFFSSIFKL
jgi:uncharacterized oligopeptide transporter (OPT) family protein